MWFQTMIPTLFPFMILTGLMIQLHLTENFSKLFSPLLSPFFPLSGRCHYIILTGFFCGFPIGAKIIGEMYREKQITKTEASLLLSFCNNIGPIFFTGFALKHIMPAIPLWGCFFGMYGIPFLYGSILYFLLYKKKWINKNCSASIFCEASPQKGVSFPVALDRSVTSAIHGITKLGGYMILFNLCNLLPALMVNNTPALPGFIHHIFGLLLEISSGIKTAGSHYPIAALSLLHFGGLSCIMQTGSMICETDLSLWKYVGHKSVQTLLAAIFYTVLYHI